MWLVKYTQQQQQQEETSHVCPLCYFLQRGDEEGPDLGEVIMGCEAAVDNILPS